MSATFVRMPVAAGLAALVLTFAAPWPARADGEGASGPGAGVARMSLIAGPVAVRRGDAPAASAAAINAPVLGADYVTTGDGARAEVQLDAAASVRLGANVQMRFTHLDANDRELQLAEGTIELRLLRPIAGRVQIDTPSVAIQPQSAGAYRVTVDADGRTQLTVRSGRAEVVSPNLVDVLVPGTTLLAQGDPSSPAIRRVDALALDDFDRFNAERDRRQERALAAAYAAPGVAGIDDLDAYGRWVSDAGYGRVWTPSAVEPGWAPYRDGRWLWEEGYGWTWLGAEPWGWAPYHYGRWYRSAAYGWCWVPVRAAVPWSPALVSFVSFGGPVFGTIGWVPLAPYEPVSPWWGNGSPHRDGHGERGRHFRNAVDGGVTAIPRRRFLAGHFERPAAPSPAWLGSLRAVQGGPAVEPSAANLRFSERPVSAALALRPALLSGSFAGGAAAPRAVPVAQHPAAARPAEAARDPWTRFAAGAPSRGVTVITGSTATVVAPARSVRETKENPRAVQVSDPWARFAAPAPHPAAAVRPAVEAPRRTTVSPVRTIEGPDRATKIVEPPRVETHPGTRVR